MSADATPKGAAKCPYCGRPATSYLVHFTDPCDLWNTGCHSEKDDGFGLCSLHNVEWGVTLEESVAAWNAWARHPEADTHEKQDARWAAVVSRYYAQKGKQSQRG